MKEILITKNEEGIKVFKLIKKIFPNMPDSLIYKLLRKKYFEINGKKATGKEEIKNGDKISIFLSEETINKYIKEKKQKENKFLDKYFDEKRIVYEDENIIIYNKPVGLLSQSDKKEKVSINDILKEYIINKEKNELINSTGIVNRLDRNTEGLIIFAKNYMTAKEISKMIKEHKVEKRYKALVNGVIKKEEGELINTYIKDSKKNLAKIGEIELKNNKKNLIKNSYDIVKLNYKVIKKYENTTLVDINLITGKSHQIRAQFSYIGHPLVCDKKYMENSLYKKNNNEYNKNSQFLKCYKIKFSTFENNNLKYLNNKEFIL